MSKPKECDWMHETAGVDDYWETGCGEAHQFIDGGPKENDFEFCPYCGRKLKAREVPREQA